MLACIGIVAFLARHHRISWFVDDLVSAAAHHDAKAFSQLTSPVSAELIRAKYGEYVALMVESPDGYFVLGPNPNIAAIEEAPISDALRQHWFGYLPDPQSVHAFKVSSPHATITVYAIRTYGGWRHVIQDPSDIFEKFLNNQ